MSDETAVRFEPDDKPSHLLSAGLGLQMTVMIITGIMLTPLIVGREAGLPVAQINWLVFAALVACGISTWLQISRIVIIGGRYLLFVGSNVAFISVAISALTLGGPSLLLTLVCVGSLATFIFTSQMGSLRKVLTPAIGGVVLMLMALNVAPVVWSMLKKVPVEFQNDPSIPMVFLSTLVPIIVIMIYGKKIHRLWAPLIGILVGYVYSFWIGLIDVSTLQSSSWLGFPEVHWPGFTLIINEDFWALLPAFILITFVGCIETYADGIAVQKKSYKKTRPINFKSIQGAINADGLGSFIAGALGSVPNTVYSMSIGVMEITRVAALRVGFWGGLFIILFGLSPKLLAVVASIPSPVAAAYILIIILMLFGHGLEMVNENNLGTEGMLAVCLGFFAGVGFQGGFLFNEFFHPSMQVFLSNGTTSGGMVAVFIMFLLIIKKRSRFSLSVPLIPNSLKEINTLVINFSKKYDVDMKTQNRIMLIAEEGLNFLLENQDKKKTKKKNVTVKFFYDAGMTEIEFISKPIDVNAESAVIALKESGEVDVEKKLSLKLLYGLTADLKHLQYHGMDYLFLKLNKI